MHRVRGGLALATLIILNFSSLRFMLSLPIGIWNDGIIIVSGVVSMTYVYTMSVHFSLPRLHVSYLPGDARSPELDIVLSTETVRELCVQLYRGLQGDLGPLPGQVSASAAFTQ